MKGDPVSDNTVASVRLDAWLCAVRLTKTRGLASDACRGGHVRLNGNKPKAASPVRPGDRIVLTTTERVRNVVVEKLIAKRVGAPVAVQCYRDESPPPPERGTVALFAVRDRGAGRPTKRERRDIERLRGRETPTD